MISVDDAILKEIPSPLIAGGLIKTMEQVNEILSREFWRSQPAKKLVGTITTK